MDATSLLVGATIIVMLSLLAGHVFGGGASGDGDD